MFQKVWHTFFFLLFSLSAGAADVPMDVEFRADFFTRDMATNTEKGRGNAWLRKGNRQIWADEVEIDFNSNRAIANGNVHIKDEAYDIWCRHASYNLKGDDAILDDATIVQSQMVVTGNVVKKLSRTQFEITDGSYSNCNLDLRSDSTTGRCEMDWKIYGKSFSITVGDYAHISDALLSIKSFPIFYTPYIIVPVKTERQSGFLTPSVTYLQTLGNGFSLPYFVNLGTWHDLTLTPTLYQGPRGLEYFQRTEYRYLYSARTFGNLSFSFTDRKFNSDRLDPGRDNPDSLRTLGFLGEWALNLHNQISFGERSYSKQILRLVSDPFFSQDYRSELAAEADLGYLRSLVSFTSPGDLYYLGARAQYEQTLVVSRDQGADRGPVSRLPDIMFSRSASPLLDKYLSFEFDSRVTNFYRSTAAYDSIPPEAAKTGEGTYQDSPDFDDNDFLRTGRRVQLEPRLFANVPMPPGFQFQPLLRGGSLIYQFDVPQTKVIQRNYLETELPLSMYMSKSFTTSMEGFEQISHVLQPRVIYASNLYHDDQTPDVHPFFNLASPRFDIADELVPYRYLRFELINRLRRRWAHSSERFFLLKLSEQYNFEKYARDPRYANRLGPIEVLSELTLWRFIAQLQAIYPLELNQGMRETEWTGSVTYRSPEGDAITTSGLFRQRVDPALTEQSVYFTGYKVLPTFFDLGGSFEYSARRGEMVGYSILFRFAPKPRTCWELNFRTGKDAYKRAFAGINFTLLFGSPGGRAL